MVYMRPRPPVSDFIPNVDLEEVKMLTIEKARKIVVEHFIIRPYKEAGKSIFLPVEEWPHPEKPLMTAEAREEVEHWLEYLGLGRVPDFYVGV